MDRRSQQEPGRSAPAPAARTFAPVAADRDATYPMLAPAAAVATTSDQDAEDVRAWAGHVNV